MTTRDRRAAKAERLREWAAKRETKAESTFEAGAPYGGDWAFITQPGHIPLRARVIAREDRAHESLRKADGMRSRADGIEDQLERSIYSDDPDAAERLGERIATLEAERDRIKSDNAAFRKAHPELRAMTAYERDRAMPHPSYRLSNLTANIKRNRDRLAGLERDDDPTPLPARSAPGFTAAEVVEVFHVERTEPDDALLACERDN